MKSCAVFVLAVVVANPEPVRLKRMLALYACMDFCDLLTGIVDEFHVQTSQIELLSPGCLPRL